MIKSMRWRLGLSFLGTALALGAAVVSQSQVGMLRPGTHYRGALVYSEDGTLMGPKAQVASYCVNMPAFVVANIVHARLISYDEAFYDQNWFPLYGYAEYYLAVIVFWWCIGWYLDRRIASRSNKSSATAIIAAVGATLSLRLVYDGIAVALRGAVPRGPVLTTYAMPISGVLWGFALTGAFLLSLYEFFRQWQSRRKPGPGQH